MQQLTTNSFEHCTRSRDHLRWRPSSGSSAITGDLNKGHYGKYSRQFDSGPSVDACYDHHFVLCKLRLSVRIGMMIIFMAGITSPSSSSLSPFWPPSAPALLYMAEPEPCTLRPPSILSTTNARQVKLHPCSVLGELSYAPRYAPFLIQPSVL